MSYLNTNLDEVTEPTLHDPGFATLSIKDLTVKENKAGDGAYANLQLEVIDNGGVPTDNKSPIWHICSFKPNAMFGLHGVATACGVTSLDLKGFAKEFYEAMGNPGSFQELQAVAEPWLKERLLGQQFRDEIKIDVYKNSATGVEKKSNKLAGKFKRA